jgi:hypothetical protein
LTGYPLSNLTNFKEDIFEQIKSIDGKLIVKEYPTKSASSNTIRNHLARLVKRGIEPDVIIIDYADLLKPTVIRKEKRNELESIYEELRAIATEHNCSIWTASQTNRSGLNAEVITMEQISEAFNKCFVADFIFTISRTIEDKQKNRGKMFIAKNRNGVDGLVFTIHMDTSNVDIRVIPSTPSSQIQTNPVILTSKDQSDLLKEKYNKLKRRL